MENFLIISSLTKDSLLHWTALSIYKDGTRSLLQWWLRERNIMSQPYRQLSKNTWMMYITTLTILGISRNFHTRTAVNEDKFRGHVLSCILLNNCSISIGLKERIYILTNTFWKQWQLRPTIAHSSPPFCQRILKVCLSHNTL